MGKIHQRLEKKRGGCCAETGRQPNKIAEFFGLRVELLLGIEIAVYTGTREIAKLNTANPV